MRRDAESSSSTNHRCPQKHPKAGGLFWSHFPCDSFFQSKLPSWAVPSVPCSCSPTTQFYSLHLHVFFCCLPLQFGALLKLYWDARQLHTDKAKTQLLEKDKKYSLPAPSWVCSEQSKVDCMEIVIRIKQAITSAFECLVAFPSSLKYQM